VGESLRDDPRARFMWRTWIPGRKHGIARGIAVVGQGTDATVVGEMLRRADRLRAWCRDTGVVLTGQPADLRALDEAIARPGIALEVMAWLPLEAGLYLGTLAVDHIAGAGWTVWPIGHPVVRIPGRGDVDVTEIGGCAFAPGGAGLWAAYQRLAA
jgi:Family of unknown function (DUF6278)